MSIRYVSAQGETLEEMKDNARKSDLYDKGDMTLIWVNTGDLLSEEFSKVFNEDEKG